MNLTALITSEAGLTLVGTLLGGIWTFFRSRDWYRDAQREKYVKALRALEAGVELTYRTYVRAIKRGRRDGTLTDDEVRRAREEARRAALRFGRTAGIDVVRELGEPFIDLWITKLVQRAKRAA